MEKAGELAKKMAEKLLEKVVEKVSKLSPESIAAYTVMVIFVVGGGGFGCVRL